MKTVMFNEQKRQKKKNLPISSFKDKAMIKGMVIWLMRAEKRLLNAELFTFPLQNHQLDIRGCQRPERRIQTKFI
jgi:hypothetical protein